MRFFNDPKYKVFKIKPNSKIPFDSWNSPKKWENFQGCQYEEGYNYAMYLEGSNLVAIDYDPRNETEDTQKVLSSIQCFLDATYSHATPSGGRHYIFSLEPEIAYPFKGQMCDGVDIKYNGYIVIPPSSIDKKSYHADFMGDQDIIPLPLEVENKCLNIVSKTPSLEVPISITPDRDKKFDLWKMIEDLKPRFVALGKGKRNIWVDLGMCLYNIKGEDASKHFYYLSDNENYPTEKDKLDTIRTWSSFKSDKDTHKYGIPRLKELLSLFGLDIDKYPDLNYYTDSIMKRYNEREEMKTTLPEVSESMKLKNTSFKNDLSLENMSLNDLKNQIKLTDHIKEDEIRKILKSITQSKVPSKSIGQFEDFLADMSVKFFNQFVIYVESTKVYAVLKNIGTALEDFILFSTPLFKERFNYLHIKTANGREIYLTDFFIKSDRKRIYTEIVHAPYTDRKDYYSVFARGCVSIEPVATDYDEETVRPFLDFIKFNICGIGEGLSEEELGAKEGLYKYILWYMAHTLRRPQQKQSVILCLWGEQGTGKNIFTSTFQALFQDVIRMTSSATPDQLEGQYTDFLRGFLVVIDEFPPKLDSKSWGRLKAYSGSSNYIVMNPKGEKQYKGAIYARFITTSNLYPAFGETSDNRRIVRIQTQKNITDFSKLARMKGDNHFLHEFAKYLNTIDLDEFEPCLIPKDIILTEEDKKMERGLKREQTKDSEYMYEMLLELLSVDEAPYIARKRVDGKNDVAIISVKHLFRILVKKFKQEYGRKSMEFQNAAQFLIKMFKFYPNPVLAKPSPISRIYNIHGEYVRAYRLDEFREYFQVEGNQLFQDDQNDLDTEDNVDTKV